MLRYNIVIIFLFAAISSCGPSSSSSSTPENCPATVPTTCPATPPDYTKDIAPIITNNCSQCHGPGQEESTPHPLDTYAEVYSQRGAVQKELAHCMMPAPGADHPMSDTDRETMLTWLACNAPESASSPTPTTNPNTTPTASCSTTDTWNNFGEQFFANDCASCHGAGHNPGTGFFDPTSYSSVMGDASDIASQIKSGSMPKNATLDSSTKQRILAWLSCNPQPF